LKGEGDMKLFTSKDKRTELEKERDAAIEELRNTTWTADTEVDEEDKPKKNIYNEKLKRIERLNELIGEKPKKGISPDTALLVAANILGIILIISHEKVNVITSKALGFVMRGRV
jgi:hypothetical protein